MGWNQRIALSDAVAMDQWETFRRFGPIGRFAQIDDSNAKAPGPMKERVCGVKTAEIQRACGLVVILREPRQQQHAGD